MNDEEVSQNNNNGANNLNMYSVRLFEEEKILVLFSADKEKDMDIKKQ